MPTAFLIGAAFAVVSTTLVLGCYALMRRIAGRALDDHTKDLASSVIFRVSALHGLIIALVFAQEMGDFQNIRNESSIEATAVADIYNDSARFGDAAKSVIQPPMVAYLDAVIEIEWPRLGRDEALAPEAWAAWEQAYQAVLDLDATTPRETALRDHMLARIHDISEQRELRAAAAESVVDRLFWMAAVAGVVFMSLAYYTFPPTRFNLTLLCLFGIYTGIILFFIYAFSNPYEEPARVDPEQFARLLAEIRAGDPATPP
jgi:hypothetical protein